MPRTFTLEWGALTALSRSTINVEKRLRRTRPLRHKPHSRNASERTISEAPRKTNNEAITSNKNNGELRTQTREEEGYKRETNASERTTTVAENHAYAYTIQRRTSQPTKTITSQRIRTGNNEGYRPKTKTIEERRNTEVDEHRQRKMKFTNEDQR